MSRVHFFCVLILTSSVMGTALGKDEQSGRDKASEFGTCYGWKIVGGVVVAAALPVALPALGFGAGEIAVTGAAGVGVETGIASRAATLFAECSGPDYEEKDKQK